MIKCFYPALDFKRISDIDFEVFINNGIKGIILDIDNTLAPSGMHQADPLALDWLKTAMVNGYKLCIVSNASRKRVDKFNLDIGLKAVYRASKPGKKAFKKALDILGTCSADTAVIGDQLFTDIYGGNKMGMLTILVLPINPREFLFVKFKRIFERGILFLYRRKKRSNE